MFTVAAAALLAGFLGGLTGIGGVILVPALTEFAEVPIDVAIATAMFAFIFSGSLAAYLNLRRVKLGLVPVAALCIAAALGALLGTMTLDWLPGRLVRLFVAAAAMVSGLHAMLNQGRPSAKPRTLGNAPLAALGFVVGWGSAISGTGGPVMLIPMLLILGIAPATAVGFGLAAHLPIIVAATAVHFVAGRIDFPLGAVLGGLMVIGTLVGTWLFSRLSGRHLTVCVALALIAVGGWYAFVTFTNK
jgi:uncharacterized membrane protein YfcA